MPFADLPHVLSKVHPQRRLPETGVIQRKEVVLRKRKLFPVLILRRPLHHRLIPLVAAGLMRALLDPISRNQHP
jgi:hypothetical protein